MRPLGSKPTESELIRAAKAGNEAAITQLIDAHWHRAWRASMSVLLDTHRAEDLAQEAILRAISSLDTFDAERPFGPWVERITINACLDWLRRSSSHERPTESPPEKAVQEHFSDPDLVTAMETLDHLDRAAVVMRHVLRYRVTEIAELLGLSETATGSRLHRAMKALRSALTKQQEEARR